jgi:hypothetical protein
MRRFIWGVLVGWAVTYGYINWDSFVFGAQDWFARASAAPDSRAKIDKMFKQ